ncbi:MAG: hypothetical protein IJY93_06985 [Clostridia bacterium]|nr:hypothetical protein [Clostridia bacterium]
MKFNIYKRLLCIALAVSLITVFFTLGASANLSFRNSGGMSRSSEGLADDTAGEDGIVHEPDTTDNMNNAPGSDSAPGTGEFGDDTSRNDTTRDTTSKHPVDSAIDNAVTDATDAVDDATDGMGIWGVVIIIAIIAAIAILLFAFFARRK